MGTDRNNWNLYQLPRYDGNGYVFAVLQRIDTFELRHRPEYPRNVLPECWQIVCCDRLGDVVPTECFVSQDRAAVMEEWQAMTAALCGEVA